MLKQANIVFRQISVLIIFPLTATYVSAQSQSPTFTEAGEYNIYHTVFNSSFLAPEIATIYGIIRGKDKAVINVAVTKMIGDGSGDKTSSLGLPVQVTGIARNLMQQSTKLDFQQIQEQDATYYIADFEFDDQEIMHFYLDVVLPGQSSPTEIEFTKSSTMTN